MIRTTLIRPLVTATSKKSSRFIGVSTTRSRIVSSSNIADNNMATLPLSRLSLLPLPRCNGLMLTRHYITQSPYRRSLSSSSSGNQNKTETKGKEEPLGEGETSQEMVLTPGQKVVAGTRLFFWAGAFTLASFCAYYIGKELLPTKMSPNTVFDKATNEIRKNEEVKRRFGEGFKTYGRDHGGHREGRRNFIEHTEYTAEDGSKRTRVRFNLEGPHGGAFVFAEVSNEMKSGEFVYILVQDKRNGAVITIQDNRAVLLAKQLAGGSQEGQNVFANLLGGGSKN